MQNYYSKFVKIFGASLPCYQTDVRFLHSVSYIIKKLFNLYINAVIGELSSRYVGYFVYGVYLNNISFTDDMMLLVPSINAFIFFEIAEN